MLHLGNSNFLPASEPVPRFDVLTAPPKRRTFTPEEKAKLVAESFTSGESVCAFARRHGLMPSQLFAWRKLARGGSSPGTERPREPAASRRPNPGLEPPQIEITLGPITVRVPQDIDPATLKAVLKALREAA